LQWSNPNKSTMIGFPLKCSPTCYSVEKTRTRRGIISKTGWITMKPWAIDLLKISAALLLVLVNGFFVAVEFALVKLREGQLNELIQKQRPFAKTALWLQRRLDASLSACQLGITMASLGLGWIGEPAIAHLLRPMLVMIGIETDFWLHGIAFVVAFTLITAAHLVIGEQTPKIYALRRPETVALMCAGPLKAFYYFSYPLMVALNASTSFLLTLAGIDPKTSHQEIPTEAELRTLLQQARTHGHLSRSEHRLISAVLEFDDIVCRKVMQPRIDVAFLDIDHTIQENLAFILKDTHSRYPVCQGSLDNVLGIVHIKDLISLAGDDALDLRSILRPSQFVPETIPVSRLLRQFQASHQHMAFVVDEYGITVGVVTLEDVIEQIVGPVEDEFDEIVPQITPESEKSFIVLGNTPVETVNQALNLSLDARLADTFSGFLMSSSEKILSRGDSIKLPGAEAEVQEIEGRRAKSVRVTIHEPKQATVALDPDPGKKD
jgi:CBS domain containing-hemolysin-like protein